MANFNQVTLIGNLTRDLELRYTPKGTAVAKAGLAINRKWTNDSGERKEEVVFVDVDMFGKTAENTAQYMRKGGNILISGRLKLDKWDDKQTGQKKSRLGVIAESVQFLGGGDGNQTERQPGQERAAQKPLGTGKAPAATAAAPVAGDGPDESDNVPF